MSNIFTATPAPKRPPSITLADLLDGIRQYLAFVEIEFDRIEFEPFYRDASIDTNGTAIHFHNVKEHDEAWETGRYIFFEIYEKACRVVTSRIGGGPFEVYLVATIERARVEAGCRAIADLTVSVEEDRSLSFDARTPPRPHHSTLKLKS